MIFTVTVTIHSEEMREIMNRAANIIHLDAARRQGLTGKGIGVAIFDTGIGYHPDLFPAKGRAGLSAFYDTFQ